MILISLLLFPYYVFHLSVVLLQELVYLKYPGSISDLKRVISR